MSLHQLQWGTCQTHGRSLHHAHLCTSCHPAAEPRVPQREPVYRCAVSAPLGVRATQLTAKEIEVAQMLGTGRTQLQIAMQIGISRDAVETRIRRACDRMNLLNTDALVRYVRGESVGPEGREGGA